MKTFDEAIESLNHSTAELFVENIKTQVLESITNPVFQRLIIQLAVQTADAMLTKKSDLEVCAALCHYLQRAFEFGRRVGIEMERSDFVSESRIKETS